MKNLIYRIIIINLSCLFLFHCFNTAEDVYGEENKGYITEGDIIITTDDLDKVPDVEVSEKTVVSDVKKERKEKDEGKKSLLSYKVVSEYLKNGKKYEARNELSDLYFAETDKDKQAEIKNKLDELNAELVFYQRTQSGCFHLRSKTR